MSTCLFFNPYLFQQSAVSGIAQWATRISGGTTVGYSIIFDSSGNSYVTGTYTSTATIYNSNGTTFGTLTTAGGNDVIIVKYNTSGTAQWATHIGGIGSDVGYGIAADSSGNSYVTGGYVSTTLTIYNSNGTTFGTLTGAGVTQDVFIVKYNTSGTAQWATRLSGAGTEIGYGIATDSSGNSYITGVYGSNPLTIYNSNGTTFGTLTIAGGTDVFIVKYNTSGAAQWATRLSGTANDQGQGIAIDSSGNSYITGFYVSNPLTIYNSNGTTFGTLTGTGTNNDVFIVKYDTSGAAQWATRLSGTSADVGYGIAADSSGNSYITGSYSSNPLTIYNSNGTIFSNLTGTSTTTDVFIVKYNTSGAAQWATRVLGTGNDAGYGISVDSSGNSSITGQYGSNPLTIYHSNGTIFSNLTNAGSTDVFIVNYNTSGTAQWATRVAGTASDQGQGIAVDSSSLYVTGQYTSNPLTIYHSNGSTFGTLTGTGTTSDVFIVKYI